MDSCPTRPTNTILAHELCLLRVIIVVERGDAITGGILSLQ